VVDAPAKQPSTELPDYKELDRPAAQRKKQARTGEAELGLGKAAGQDMDYFDIPAFLRRQAD
jgi:cell division protein FtsZ